MSTLHPIPKDVATRNILMMLYGADLAVSPGSAVSPTDQPCMVAVFLNDEDQPVSACICDYNFAAFAGAALTSIPRGGAEDAAQTGDFSKMMLGNVQEVMNICSRLFMDSDSPHLRLDVVYHAVSDVPEDVMQMINSCPGRADYCIEIPGYGSGEVSFVAT